MYMYSESEYLVVYFHIQGRYTLVVVTMQRERASNSITTILRNPRYRTRHCFITVTPTHQHS